MRHVNLSDGWKFEPEPFPAFRANLVFGRNKRDREFLPVKDVTPVTEYVVTAYDGAKRVTIYAGTDKVVADKAKVDYDAQKASVEKPKCAVLWSPPTANIAAGPTTLPEGKFRVIKTRDKGTILVVPGNDDTNRCLLFVGCAGGFRGGVALVQDGTTGNILKNCSAGNNCDSSVEVIALLETGQSVAFHSYGRRTNEVYLYTWNGTEIEKKTFSIKEWETRNAVADVDAEVL